MGDAQCRRSHKAARSATVQRLVLNDLVGMHHSATRFATPGHYQRLLHGIPDAANNRLPIPANR